MCQGHVSSMGTAGSLSRSDHRVRHSIRRGSLRNVERTHLRGPAAGRRKVLTCLRGVSISLRHSARQGESTAPVCPSTGLNRSIQLTGNLAP
jgi:hypothetical protein